MSCFEIYTDANGKSHAVRKGTKMIDYFLESIASHSKDCMCSKCEKDDHEQAMEDQEAYQQHRLEEADRHNAPSEGF